MSRLLNHRRFIVGTVLAGLLPLVAAGSVASAASTGSASVANAGPHGITFTLLSRGTVSKRFEVATSGVELETRRVIDVASVRVDLQPGGTTGWHVHPGLAVATVVVGKVSLVGRDCTRHTYTAGQTFVESGPRDPNKARNVGATNAEVLATFFVPTGANPLTTAAPTPKCAGSR